MPTVSNHPHRNKLCEFPESLSLLPRLESLHASQNQITHLPHNIGNLHTLRDLRLDWNLVKQLPFSFRLLKQLTTLCMEKNPLKLPPIEHVVKGIPATLAYMEKSLDEFLRNTRRKIIERLQEILSFAMQVVMSEKEKDPPESNENHRDDDLATILSLFEPNCERVAPTGDEKLLFFAVVWEDFYATLLPALERKKAQMDQEHPSFGFDTFSVEEVEDALQKHEDDFGAASMKDSAEFRKCCCIDAFEWKHHGVRKRKVCIPGQVPYRCRRAALLVRMQMMTHEEVKDQLASTYLKKKIDRLVMKTKKKCIEYINSEQGVGHFETLAHALAKRLCQKRKRLKKLKLKQSKATQVFATKKQKLEAKIDAFRRAKESRLNDLRAKLEKLESDKANFEKESGKRDAKKRVEKLDSKIKKIQAELLEKEPVEEKKILELEIALEALEDAESNATVAIDKAKAKEMNSDDESEEENEESDDNDQDNNEGDEESDDEEEDDDEGDSEDGEKPEENTTAAAAPPTAPEGTKFFKIDMPELRFVDYRRAATQTIERELGEDKAVNEEELVILYQTHIRDAYVTEKCERVSQKATYEFLEMRAVLKRWMGLGNRAVFEAWRDFMRANRENAGKLKEKLEKKKLIEQQNRDLEEQLTRLEARKWVQRSDMYTDAIYYEQTVTGETSWYPPNYWEEEQQKQQTVVNSVPMLKLPPI